MTKYITLTLWLCFLFNIIIFKNVRAQIVLKNRGGEVRNGRILNIRKEDLSFSSMPGEVCKIEVIQNEPMYQRAGIFTPQIFDCDYLPNTLRYEHNGSPLLNHDKVKFRAYKLLEDFTIEESFVFDILILDSDFDHIRTGHVPIKVPHLNGVSNPITKDVLLFAYDRHYDNNCAVKIDSHPKWQFPVSGHLIVSNNGTSESGRFKPLSDGEISCERFLLSRVCYQHTNPPTPNIDYIPLKIIIRDGRSKSIVSTERHWIPVEIKGAFPNQPPRPNYNNDNVLEVDQFIVTNILPLTVSAIDGETSDNNLIFNISNPPEEGFITRLDGNCKSIQSFTQQDMKDLMIAYRPPNVSYPERKTFAVEFIVVDGHCEHSEPIKVFFSIRPSHTNAPRISWNAGLTLLEGQSRPINKNCLEIVDSDNLDKVRLTLSGGCQHGRLYNGIYPGYSFTWRDIVDGNIIYKHDDTDTTKDFVIFRVSDGVHSIRFKMQISVLPKDDAPPFLINNIQFEVQEGQMILIHHFMLEASDQDSSPDYIEFNITKKPSAGQLVMQREASGAPWEISSFKQKDLYHGMIYYKHNGEEKFHDEFEFILIDSCQPQPNISPTQAITIEVTPLDDIPPQPVEGITRALTCNETDVVFLDETMLNYFDEEDPDSELTFTITNSCFRLDEIEQPEGKHLALEKDERDAGKVFFTDDMVMLMKDSSVPDLKTFTQDAVNHKKVAYMPPMHEIGPLPIDVQFIYSVIDAHGQSISGERFLITVLPVDNVAPVLETQSFHVTEGGTYLIGRNQLFVSDQDTHTNELQLILHQLPVAGILEVNGRPMKKNDIFTVADIKDFRITYKHDGSEIYEDEFGVIATDGYQNSTEEFIRVIVSPIDDEIPVFKENLQPLILSEGGSVQVTEKNLEAIDVDSPNEDLMFQIIDGGTLGYVTVNGIKTDHFLQSNIISGDVEYHHNGQEVGMEKAVDSITFTVTDEHLKPGQDAIKDPTSLLLSSNGPLLYNLLVEVLPVNDRPPTIMVGSAVFSCDEAGTHKLTTEHLMADDLDTPQEELEFLILSPPSFGHIEDITPRPGYEIQFGKVIDSFTIEKLKAGNIVYIQSKHEGIEPTSDLFLVAVSDGTYTSAEVPFLIAINPTNDESPFISANNFTCEEGDMQPLISSLFNVTDLDVPLDNILIDVFEPPSHGILMDEMKMTRFRRSGIRSKAMDMHNMKPMQQFSLIEMNNHKVMPAYMHDGSESNSDQFILKVSDGIHIKDAILNVNVLSINDEKPTVTHNNGIVLELGESKIISSIVLLTEDSDTLAENLIYNIHSLPKRGNLQVSKGGTWIDLKYGDTFTQQNIEENNVRYKHSNVLGTKGVDMFKFSVTDGMYTTKRTNFKINIKYTKRSAVHISSGMAKVKEGDKVFITSDILMARDGSNQASSISFEVSTPPKFGNIEYLSFPNVPVDRFTQLDITARQIVYSHKSKIDSAVDSFVVTATNGIRSSQATIQIHIKAVDDILPTLEIISPSEDDSEDLAYLSLFRGSSVLISDSIIKITDPDSPQENLHVLITAYPQHGQLYLSENTLEGPNPTRINQEDLVSGVLTYKHSGDESGIDRFQFMVSDGVHSAYLFKGKKVQEPTTFNLKIDQIDEVAPSVVLNIPATKIEMLAHGKKYAVYIDSHSLQAEDDSDSIPDDITFSITNPPSYGVLSKEQNNDDDFTLMEFTQSDLNSRIVRYVISSKLNITNDSFGFDVHDGWGNVVMGYKFTMAWSRIQLTSKLMKICEGDEDFFANILRHGSLNDSAFVGVNFQSISADAQKDVTYNDAYQMQFDPGVKTRKWMFKVPNDNIEERKEKFKITLNNPVNTVLDPSSSSLNVLILDASHKDCKKSLKGGKSMLENTVVSVQRSRKNRKGNKKNVPRKSKSKSIFDRPQKQPGISQLPGSPIKLKYGKLGSGVTVPPDSYYRDQNERIWKYHALIPITIDEAEEHQLPPNIQNINEKVLPVSQTQMTDDNTFINDAPRRPSNQKMFNGKVTVQNSNSTAAVTVQRSNQLSSADININTFIPQENIGTSSSTSYFPRRCTIYMSDRLYFDPVSKILHRCDGANWLPWSPSKFKSSSILQKTVKKCDMGWKLRDNKCFLYISTTVISWNAAHRNCRENHNAHLASIQSNKQMKWLRKLTSKSLFWIGLNRKFDPSTWEWSNSEEVTYTNWKRRHPKPASNENGEKNCALVLKRKKWIEKSCAQRINNVGYVCMKPMNS